MRGVLSAIALLLGAACSSEERAGALSEGCVINSDCSAPLVCAFKRCHSQCETSRDCPPASRCVVSDRPFHVCQLEGERACVYNSSCPEGQVCAVDAECRDQCRGDSDCVPGQLCAGGTCAEPHELWDGQLPVVRKDAGVSTGQPCSYNSQCPDRLVCIAGVCQVECVVAADCPSGRACSQNRCQVPLCPAIDAGSGRGCAFTSDCPAPLVCRAGSCACQCRDATDCPKGYECSGTRCVLTSADAIGPAGGVVVSADGRLTLQVPPGALGAPTPITVQPAEAFPGGALGPVFEVRPSGTTFAAPVTFIYRYRPDDIAPFSPTSLRLAVAGGAAWSALPTTVDEGRAMVSAQATHLSIYGLVGPSDGRDGGPADASVDAAPDGADATLDAPVPDTADRVSIDAPPDVSTDVSADGAGADGPAADSADGAGADADRCATAACSGSVADRCCPPACGPANDTDCPGCGNGRLDPGETCDPPGSCPACDDQNDCTTDTQTGSAATCDVRCQNTPKTCSAAGKDRCCPAGCSAQTDSDCAGCGDGVVDPAAGETCDPPGTCPTSCAPGQCWEIKVLTGAAATCNVRCSTTQLACSGAMPDMCCPPGCNTSPLDRDVDCAPVCGNGIVEARETCDGNCPTANTCVSDIDTVRTLSGAAASCDVVCSAAPRACSPQPDGFCPSSCSSATDGDCPPANDACAGAVDISAGGTFGVDLTAVTKQDAPPVSGCDAAGPDVFYRITLTGSELIYLSVLDYAALGSAVPAALELYAGGCPPNAAAVTCDRATRSAIECGRDAANASFPLVTSSVFGALAGKPLGPGTFVVAVRGQGGTGHFTLTYHHVPAACSADSEISAQTSSPLVSTTCQRGNRSSPSCAAGGEDANYVIFKCPSQLWDFDTCQGRTASPTVLSAFLGSLVQPAAAPICQPSGDGREVACSAAPPPGCTAGARGGVDAAQISNAGGALPGILTVSVDTRLGDAGASCGFYGLGFRKH